MPRFFIILLILFFIPNCLATINSINSINSKEIECLQNEIDNNTLILIDINYTLILPQAKIFSTINSPYFSLINSLISYRKSDNHAYDQALINWYNNKKIKLVENNWPILVDNLKHKGSTVIGVANLDSTWYELINNPEQKLYLELKSLGVNFTKEITNKTIFKIGLNKEPCSLFYHGIIFNGSSTNKQTILQFLKETTLMPTSIIVFSHNKNFINQISQIASDLRINYYGFIYNGINQFVKTDINHNIINLQHKLLLESAQWLEDEEAEKLVNSNSKY